MDIFMPVLNGIQATKKIRNFEKENNLEKTPILIVSGNYTKYDRLRTQNIAYDDFLCKPLDKDILLQCLKRVQDKKNIDKVLIIEDDKTQAFVLEQMLSSLQVNNVEIKSNFTELKFLEYL